MRRRHNQQQIAEAVRLYESGASRDQLARQYQVSNETIRRWIREHGRQRDELTRLRDENQRLKILLAEKDLDLASIRTRS